MTRIEFRRIKGRGNGQQKDDCETVLGVFRFFFQHNDNESMIKIQTYLSGSPLRSDGVDRTGDANRTPVWVTHRTTGRGGQTMIGSIWTHSYSGQNSRRATHVEREVGQPYIEDLKGRQYTVTVSGISHRSAPCLRPTGQIV